VGVLVAGKRSKFLDTVAGIDGFKHFDLEAYKRRLVLLRVIASGASQQAFADLLGMPVKRWANYERGFPVPREAAFMLVHKFPGLSIEWVWFGWTAHLSPEFQKKIEKAEASTAEHQSALAQLAEAQKKVEQTRPGTSAPAKRKARA
jgi:transcriptional regulator with XRE-family HTH domain